MQKLEDTTFSVPRFLSFIDLGYLLEAAKAADEHLAAKLPNCSADDGMNVIGNLNATRQSLLRAIFISSYAVIEQNFDELVLMEREKSNILLSPHDLKDRGISRSLTYAKKVLGGGVDTKAAHWKDLILLQELRNHLVHYGPSFADTKDHGTRFNKFAKSNYVTLRPVICFTIEQIENVFELYMTCVDDFIGK
ncbi:hypothetical protein [Vreelandella neptunia]|uniref:RiboL-PSP-HEPN domain-containing protein n=1 Tax=Vreelandella neptunia TaxID=115551 RepID=A0ABS9SD90_9GAMM|nr:hypothetical protein [Halomonas neptunia]MCH4814080.1 hypothetical protein [Halomonas neptunia]